MEEEATNHRRGFSSVHGVPGVPGVPGLQQTQKVTSAGGI